MSPTTLISPEDTIDAITVIYDDWFVESMDKWFIKWLVVPNQ